MKIAVSSVLLLAISIPSHASSKDIHGTAQCAFSEGKPSCIVDIDGEMTITGSFKNDEKATKLLGMVGKLAQEAKSNKCGYKAKVTLKVSRFSIVEEIFAEMILLRVVSNTGLKLNRKPSEEDMGYGTCRIK